jgi:cytochrome c2
VKVRFDGENAHYSRRVDRRIQWRNAGAGCREGCDGLQEMRGLPQDRSRGLVGPELNALDGRHSGSVPNFSYSDANKNSGIVWNAETFEDYIKDPKAKIPGTKMIFASIKNEQEAKDLWAYIKQFDPQGNIKK